jgi:hypothetical protein
MSTRLLALGASAAILFAACGTGATTAPTTAPTGAATPGATAPGGFSGSLQGCLVTDTGGLGDKGFNDNALGPQDALAAGYAPRSEPRVEEGRRLREQSTPRGRCLPVDHDGRFTWATRRRPAHRHDSPSRSSTRLRPASREHQGIVFATQEAGMLAVTRRRRLGDGQDRDLGGLPIPPVTDFMDGLWAIQVHNQENGKASRSSATRPARQAAARHGEQP